MAVRRSAAAAFLARHSSAFLQLVRWIDDEPFPSRETREDLDGLPEVPAQLDVLVGSGTASTLA